MKPCEYGAVTTSSIKEAERIYKECVQKLKDIQHIKEVLYSDWVATACSSQNKYSLLEPVIIRAWEQQNLARKKERPDFEFIKNEVILDFFGGDKATKLISIIWCGLDFQFVEISCKYKGRIFVIGIPMTKNITVDNFETANLNRFSLCAETKRNHTTGLCDSYTRVRLCDSYSVDDIAKSLAEFDFTKTEE